MIRRQVTSLVSRSLISPRRSRFAAWSNHSSAAFHDAGRGTCISEGGAACRRSVIADPTGVSGPTVELLEASGADMQMAAEHAAEVRQRFEQQGLRYDRT